MEHIHELLLIMSFVAVSAVKAILRCVNQYLSILPTFIVQFR
jgi:hypothetical protein